MLRLFILILMIAISGRSTAQIRVHEENPGIDTLRIVFHDDKWAIEHRVEENENIFMLSRRYHVPPALLADMNGINFQAALHEDSILYIPFGPYNQAKGVSANRFDTRPLSYIVRKYDNLFRLAHLAGVPQRTIQEWNGMPDNYIEEGKYLFVGWVLYDMSAPVADTVVVNQSREDVIDEGRSEQDNSHPVTRNKDGQTVVTITVGNMYDTLPEIEKAYMAQTDKETVVTEEKGTAVFFENKGKLKSNTTYFAFHNTAKPGTIIKVYNPGTDKTVFVKVLGAIPNTKQYYNSVIGISNGAKEELMVTEDKAWCELKFAPSN